MTDYVVLLSIPGLRASDLAAMPNLRQLADTGDRATLAPCFPCVTCPVQANMTTGTLPHEHGVIANGFYWRARREVEMWTAWNDCIQRPQIWDVLHREQPGCTSAVWFALHSKGCGADYICTPAPIHQADGTEALWCHTQPTELYAELLPELDHFPLQHFWGPLANIHSSRWIADSAVRAARRFRPNFAYIYLPHLDYSAQKAGPDSEWAHAALGDLDELLGRLFLEYQQALGGARVLWLVASEYTITPVDHVTFPNRVLREAGLLSVREEDGRELLDLERSRAWALVDHQFSHVFVADADHRTIENVVALFRRQPGFDQVLWGDSRAELDLVHERAGEVVLVSSPRSWQAYYWWHDDSRAPAFARRVDIHNKPGYDPLEMHVDWNAGGISLDTSLVRGSHGAPAKSPLQRGVVLASQPGVFPGPQLADIDMFGLVLEQFGV